MAQSANVLIYSIGLLDELSADQNPAVLKKVAAATGGDSYFPSSAAEVVGIAARSPPISVISTPWAPGYFSPSATVERTPTEGQDQ
jgi:hypothetical protein